MNPDQIRQLIDEVSDCRERIIDKARTLDLPKDATTVLEHWLDTGHAFVVSWERFAQTTGATKSPAGARGEV